MSKSVNQAVSLYKWILAAKEGDTALIVTPERSVKIEVSEFKPRENVGIFYIDEDFTGVSPEEVSKALESATKQMEFKRSLNKVLKQAGMSPLGKFTIEDFKQEIIDHKPYLTCKTVDWALKYIEDKEENYEEVYDLLLKVYRNSSPMWRDSHRELYEFFGE